MSNALRTYADAISLAKTSFEGINDCPVDFEREKYFALQICERNDALQKTSMLPSLAHAVRNVALCGITLNPAMKLAYLVPRAGMVCLDISYIGLIKIATDSGSVSHVNCQLVFENDDFQLIHGTSESLEHKPLSFGNRGALIGVYTIATIHNGEKLIETMSVEEIEAVKKRSKAKSGPWLTDYCEMVRKTCVKRASKYWPKTERLAEAVNTINQHEGIDFIDPGSNQSISVVDVITSFESAETLAELDARTGPASKLKGEDRKKATEVYLKRKEELSDAK